MRDVSSAFASRTREAGAAYDRCWKSAVRVATALWIVAAVMPVAHAPRTDAVAHSARLQRDSTRIALPTPRRAG